MNTMNPSILDTIGGTVDEMFLSVPRLLSHIKPPRTIDRHTYEEQIDFYFSNRSVDEPMNFFTLPDSTPDYTIMEERPYHQGTCQLISYPSGYKANNPLIRERFETFKANRTGYIVRWTHGIPGTKTVLCLHGYMLGDPRQAYRMFHIRRLFAKGIDVALFIAPFHWKRAPSSPLKRGIFLQPDDVVMTAECMGQTMYDLHGAFMILKSLRSGAIGLIGASLGGYTAALYICLTDSASFAAMMVPAVNFSQPFGPDAIKMPFAVDDELRKKIQRVWEMHSPLKLKPKIPTEKILIVASRGDRLCPFPYVNKLCETWGWPTHYFLPGGHWLVFNNIRGKAWYQFLMHMQFTSA